MTWFKVDDGFYDHPKVDDLPLEVVGLWLLCGTYAARHLTDGVVSAQRVRKFGGTDDMCSALVRANMWRTHPEGYEFVDWGDWNPTRDEVEAERAKSRERMRRRRQASRSDQGERSEDVRANTERTSPGVRDPRPDPTRPIKSTSDSADADTRRSSSSDEEAFDEWWKKYPRKVGKGQARKAFKKALTKTTLEELHSGLEAYLVQVQEKDPDFIAHPSTWLNGERWSDEPVKKKGGSSLWDRQV